MMLGLGGSRGSEGDVRNGQRLGEAAGLLVRAVLAEGEAGHKISVWKVYAIGKSGLAV